MDLFEQNVAAGDLSTFHPGFTGGTDVEAAKKFVRDIFLAQIENKERIDMLHVHFVSLVDGTAAETILGSIQSMITSLAFEAEGL